LAGNPLREVSIIFDHLNGGDEAIAPASQSFYELGLLGRIRKCRPKPFNGSVQAAFEIDKSVVRPESSLQFLTRHRRSRLRKQECKNFHGLPVKFDFAPMFSELAVGRVKLKGAKTSETSP
jgi:hypothetical protein